MVSYLDRYNCGFDKDAVKSINELNKQIEKETDKEKLTELYMKRMCRGFEINAGTLGRVMSAYFPY